MKKITKNTAIMFIFAAIAFSSNVFAHSDHDHDNDHEEYDLYDRNEDKADFYPEDYNNDSGSIRNSNRTQNYQEADYPYYHQNNQQNANGGPESYNQRSNQQQNNQNYRYSR